MGWRQGIIQSTGPGLILGVSIGRLLKLFADNGFRIEPRYWPRTAFATGASMITTTFHVFDSVVYHRRLKDQQVLPPIFIIGHWRSGTTHLHNLLSVDDRFAYTRFAQAMIPNSFLLGEWVLRAFSAVLLPPSRMGIDEVAMHSGVPWEEEFALCAATSLSPYMSWAFPSRADYYDRYLTFRDVPPCELERWKTAFVTLLKKLSVKYEQPLLLKSPPNTARIRLLLEMFPDARFIHIHRDPYVVYQSTRHLNLKALELNSLQRSETSDVHRRIVRLYTTLFDAFFEEKSLIPPGRYCEVAFAELEREPIAALRRIYEELALPEFGAVEPAMREYVRSLGDYRKNEYPELSPDVRSELARAWQRSFDEWGYPAA